MGPLVGCVKRQFRLQLGGRGDGWGGSCGHSGIEEERAAVAWRIEPECFSPRDLTYAELISAGMDPATT